METIFGDHIEREFPAGPETEIDIHTLSGTIVVQRGADNVVRLSAAGDDDGASVAFQQDGNRLIFRDDPAEGPGDIDLNFTIPAGCAVNAESIQADINVRDIEGMVRLHTVHGDITVSNLGGERGKISLESVEGDISASRVHGETIVTSVNGSANVTEAEGTLTAQTTNGDIHVHRSQLRRFHLNTMNGDVQIATPLTIGEHYFCRSTNGDIRLTVPPDAAFVLQMKTVNGDVRCDLPHETVNGSRRNRQVRVNGGGATVELETTNGGVTVSSEGSRDREHGHEHAHHTHHHQAPTAPSITMPAMPVTPPMPVVPPISPVPPIPPVPNEGNVIDLTHLSDLDDLSGFAEAPAENNSGEPSSDTTLDVLAKLESGELTVDEAMERLEAIR
jgi:hypothetical protein